MKALFLVIFLAASSHLCFAQQAFAPAAPLPARNLAIFGRGLYPGNDTTYRLLKHSGLNTFSYQDKHFRREQAKEHTYNSKPFNDLTRANFVNLILPAADVESGILAS